MPPFRRLGVGRTPYLLGLAVSLALTIPFWLQWLDPRLDLWDVDDSKNHLIRLYHLEWLIQNGVWYPRWFPEMFLGYGYPLFNYYAPAFYYLTLGLKAVSALDFWDAFRLSGVLAVLLGSAGLYALVHAIWRRALPAIVAALAFVYAPYVFAVNLYKRGDIPEALALALIPWLLHAIWRMWHAPHLSAPAHAAGDGPTATTTFAPTDLAAGVLGALLILTHNLTALLGAFLAVLLVVYLAATAWRRDAFIRVALSGALAVGLSAFFWMPAILEAGAVQLSWLLEGNLDYRGWLLDLAGNTDRQRTPEALQTRAGLLDLHLLYPHQLVATPKASLGQLLLLLVALLSLVVAALARRRSRPTHGGLIAALALCALMCWPITFRFSQPLWDATPLLPLFQFPWRFLGLAALCLVIAAGGAFATLADVLATRRHGPAAAGAFTLVIAAFVTLNGFGTHALPLKDTLDRTVTAETVLDDELRDRLGMGTTSGREFLPRGVVIEQFSRIQARGRDVLERLYPEPEWIAGLALPLEGDLRVLALRAEPLRATVRVMNAGSSPASIGIRQAYFPGWRAWLDGRPTPLGAAPYIPEAQAAPGFLIATIPPGEHTLSVAFGPTRLRAAALLVTFVTVVATAWFAVRRSRTTPVVAAASIAVLLVAYLTWRGLSPAFGRFAALPLDRSSLIVNVAQAARTGGASLSSPGGPTLGGSNPFADLRPLTIVDRSEPPRGLAGVTTKDWLYLHPPSELSLDLSLPRITGSDRLWFQSSLALDPQTWSAPFGDGVRFQLLVGSTVILDAAINPRAQPQHRRWVPVEADLTPWAGQTIHLTLRTHPREELSSDWAGWGAPVVYLRHSARTRPRATAPPP